MTKPLFIAMAGQSNATCASISAANPCPYTPDPCVKIWTPQGFVQYAPGQNSCGVGPDTAYPNAWGMEASFMRALRLLDPTRDIYLYKRTAGGIGLGEKPVGVDDWCPESLDKEYAAMMADLATIDPALFPIDICLLVGCETDSFAYEDALDLLHNLVLFFSIIRSRTNSPNMLAIVNKIYGTWGPWTINVQNVQTGYCAQWPKALLISGEMSPAPVAPLGHFDAAGLVNMGILAFDLYAKRL